MLTRKSHVLRKVLKGCGAHVDPQVPKIMVTVDLINGYALHPWPGLLERLCQRTGSTSIHGKCGSLSWGTVAYLGEGSWSPRITTPCSSKWLTNC